MLCARMSMRKEYTNTTNIPPVNLIKDFARLGLPMFAVKIFAHPFDKVIFEYPLDELMEDVWSDQFVNICTRKMFSERLRKQKSVMPLSDNRASRLTLTLSMIPYVSQSNFESNTALQAFVCSGDRRRGSS